MTYSRRDQTWREAYDANGYVVLEGVLNGNQLGEVRGALASLLADGPSGRNDFEGTKTQLRPLIMPAGSCAVFAGTLVHRGGANRSSAVRRAISNQYCEPWARTQENFFLAVPSKKVAQMSPRIQAMLGYSIHPPFMGQVTARHPLKTLTADFENPLED